jgi:hypothetical protein
MNSDRWMYWVIGLGVVILAVMGLITYSGEKETERAQQKAQELAQAYEAAGLRVPSDQDRIVRWLGDDGGEVCESPGDALGRALVFDQLANGAAQVGRRPVIADARVLQGQRLILETYCPDKLEEFKEDFDDLKFDDTIEN